MRRLIRVDWKGAVPLRVALVVLASATAAAVVCLALRWWVVTVVGLEVSGAAVAISSALLGAMAAPPVRFPLERRDAAGRGTWIVFAGMVLSVSIVTVLGLGVLASATAMGNAVHAVQVRPTRRQMVSCCLMVVVLSAAAWGAQAAGWVDCFLEPSHASVLMVGLIMVMCPLVVNVASISRRALEADSTLEAERLSHVRSLEHAALHDTLTGLLNRLGLSPRLTRAASTAGPGVSTAVLFIDLDGFKTVNDVHGHEIGDALLREVGRRLQQVLRESAAVARIGGDEFVVVLTDLSEPEQAQAVVERIRTAIEQEVVLADGVSVVVGASIGVAVSEVSCSPDALLARADAAMYSAKRADRGRARSHLGAGAQPAWGG